MIDSHITKNKNNNMTEEVLEVNNTIKLKGYVEARIYDARYIQTNKDYLIAQNRGLLDKVTVWKDIGPNRIVDVGIQLIIDYITGASILYPTYCQNGTGNTAVTAGDTALQTPTSPRVAVAYKYRSGLSAKFDTFFDKNTENSVWAETALFNDISAGTMLSRKIYASTFTKDTTKTATVAWVWTFTAS